LTGGFVVHADPSVTKGRAPLDTLSFRSRFAGSDRCRGVKPELVGEVNVRDPVIAERDASAHRFDVLCRSILHGADEPVDAFEN
jgi:hypothetical protein